MCSSNAYGPRLVLDLGDGAVEVGEDHLTRSAEPSVLLIGATRAGQIHININKLKTSCLDKL